MSETARVKRRGVLVAGLAVGAIALLSPLHHLGQQLFTAHMIQHEVLMLIAAPLIIAGRPNIVAAWLLPRSWSTLGARFGRSAAWRIVASPAGAWGIHAVVLWGWHYPGAFEATLRSDLWHGLQHFSFMATALLFWWSVAPWRPGIHRRGTQLLSIFSTLMHTGFLGVLLTFASRPWYPAYGGRPLAYGLTPLEDQQLGGLIMWVPAGLVYVAAGLWLMWRWLRAGEQRAAIRQRAIAET